MHGIDTSRMTPKDNIPNEGIIAKYLGEANAYLAAQPWMSRIEDTFLDREMSGKVAVFFFEIAVTKLCPDSGIWVIVGDIPPAFIDIAHCKNGAQALLSYCYNMAEWVYAVDDNKSVDKLIPVVYHGTFRPVDPAEVFASFLWDRIDMIRNSVMSEFAAEIK